jgi:hypothetical protein
VVAGACCLAACHREWSRYGDRHGEVKHLFGPGDEAVGTIVADGCDVGIINADELVAQVVNEDHGGGRHRAVPEEDAYHCTIAVCRRRRWARAER